MAPSSRQRHAGDAGDAAASQPLLSGSRHPMASGYAGTATNDASAVANTPAAASTSAGGNRNGNGNGSTFNPTLGALDAFAIVISIVIGSGIFTSPGAIDTNSPSPGAALLVWLVGGILAWTGAATMAELGTAIPGEGGVQPYLKYCFGDAFGFLAAWTWIVAVMPATLAILSIVFVESIYTARGITDGAAEWTHKLLSIVVVVLVSIANCISTKASTQLNKFFVGTKFLAIAAVVLAGLVVVIMQLIGTAPGDDGDRDWVERNWFTTRPVVNPDGSVNDWQGLGTWEILGFYSTALYGALWAYSGWDKAVYISAELSQPAKQLPLAINTAIPTIIACFLAANAAYYVLLPWNIVSTTDSVAVTAITRLMGRGFGIVAAIVICLVVAGSLLGNSFVAGRMAVAAANTGWFPSIFSVVGRLGRPEVKPANDSSSISTFPDPAAAGSEAGEEEASDAPINAIVLSALLSALYIVLGSFRALVTFNGLGEYTFFFLAVLGALVLRWREPELKRPYKPLVIVPGIFVVVSGFVVVRGAIFAPAQAVVLLALWAVGLVVYWVRRKWFSSV